MFHYLSFFSVIDVSLSAWASSPPRKIGREFWVSFRNCAKISGALRAFVGGVELRGESNNFFNFSSAVYL